MTHGRPELGMEYPPPCEGVYAKLLAELLQQKVQEDYPTGITRRDAHAKHHGCIPSLSSSSKDDFCIRSFHPEGTTLGLVVRSDSGEPFQGPFMRAIVGRAFHG